MDKKKALITYLAGQGIVMPQDQEAEIAKMAAQVSNADVANLGLTTDVDKAYRVMEVLTGAGSNAPATQTQSGAIAKPADEMTDAQRNQIYKVLTSQSSREAITGNTSIEALVLDRPAPASIIKEGSTGTINMKSWENIAKKIADGDYVVCEDDGADVDADKRIASTTNYNAIVKAVANNEQLPIHIGNLSTKPIGYIVVKGSATGAGTEKVQMKRENFLRFLVLEGAGYIQASEGKPGAQIKYVEPKSVETAKGPETKPGHTVIVDKNKKEAIEANAYVISRVVTSEVTEQACKSELAFRVIDKTKTGNGTDPVKKVIRVSLKAPLPVTQRDVAYVEEFGTGERESNSDFKNPPTQAQLEKIANAHIKAINAFQRDAKKDVFLQKEIGSKLEAFEVAGTSPKAVL